MIPSFGRRGTVPQPVAAQKAPKAPAAETGNSQISAAQQVAARNTISEAVMELIDPANAVRMDRAELQLQVEDLVAKTADKLRLLLNHHEQHTLAVDIVNDMVGLGPLEQLLRDEKVSDILVNGAYQIYVERAGKLELTTVRFRDNDHVTRVVQRIASAMGRRIDESSPMLDARLADGSRVNVITPPLSLKGPCVSIRKFMKINFDSARLVAVGTASPQMARVLDIVSRCRMNIIISGGTGSGKTSLLNAMSCMIDQAERVVTIEDAAELQLHQPHVIQLETRPPNIEGHGQVTQRDLVRNALRMRPDRIIVGEVRGVEAFDMLQAMNTGHSGSMSTIHANSCRDALARIENMVMMADLNLPSRAIRAQIVSAIDLIVHIERGRDGIRRITEVSEIVGQEEDVITLMTLFKYRYIGENSDGTLSGVFEASGARPHFLPRVEYFGLGAAFMEAMAPPAAAEPGAP